MKNAKNTVIAVAMVAALAAAGITAGCASQNYVPGFDTPGLVTAASDDAVKAAGEKAEADRQAAYAAEQAARASENARKAIEAKEAALDEAALDGGEIVDDANAPEGTVAVRTATGETRYVASDKAQQSVDSGKTAPKKSESASNGGSGSSNKGGNGASGNSGSSSSGSSNGGGSASKPAPAPEPEPAPAPEPAPEPEPAPAPKPAPDDSGMHDSSHNVGDCLDCGYHANGHYGSCPSCGSSEWINYWE